VHDSIDPSRFVVFIGRCSPHHSCIVPAAIASVRYRNRRGSFGKGSEEDYVGQHVIVVSVGTRDKGNVGLDEGLCFTNAV
jgi:hypothetical protein